MILTNSTCINDFPAAIYKQPIRVSLAIITSHISSVTNPTLTAVTVSPALVLPMPVVRTERGESLEENLRN